MGQESLFVTAFKSPLYVAWEITHQCNAKCKHCYSFSGPASDSSNELSTQQAIQLIDQLADAGLMVLAFSGGEPMLRKDWRTLVEHAVRRELSVNIGTNGSTITDKTAALLKEIGVKSVTVSLDSHNSSTHDEFRQLSGLFHKTTRAIKLLADKGVRVVVGFTPTRINWRDGRKVIELAADLGAEAVNLSEYVPAGRGSIDLALSPDDLHTVLEEWVTWREEYKNKITIIWHDCRVGMLVPENERRDYVGCGAGRLLARILPDGSVTPCVFLPSVIGKFPESSFSTIWTESDLLSRFRDRSNISGNCGDCEHINSCGGCRAVSYAYSNGDPLAGDPHCWVKSNDSPLMQLAKGEALPI